MTQVIQLDYNNGMPTKINKTLVKKIRDYRVIKQLGFKAIAKLMPKTKTGKTWDIRQVQRYWNYGIRLGLISTSDIKLVKNRTEKFNPKSG